MRGIWAWRYCKTHRQPYDLCVMAALVVLEHHMENALAVASDGSDSDWQPAT